MTALDPNANPRPDKKGESGKTKDDIGNRFHACDGVRTIHHIPRNDGPKQTHDDRHNAHYNKIDERGEPILASVDTAFGRQ